GSASAQASAGKPRACHGGGEAPSESAAEKAGEAGSVGRAAGSRAGDGGASAESGGGGTAAGGGGASSGDYRGRTVDEPDVCRFDGRRQHRRRGPGHPAGGGGIAGTVQRVCGRGGRRQRAGPHHGESEGGAELGLPAVLHGESLGGAGGAE